MTAPHGAPAQEAADTYHTVAETVRGCESVYGALQVCGGGTLAGGARPGAVRVDTRAFDRLVDHAVADMTVTVQAGMTVAALQKQLAAHGQELALDVPLPERTTVGGLIAADLNGSRRLACGAVRDQLIGVRVVGAGGELIRGGGRVVKNVAGYDLCKLYTGSLGWLGVIVEATFRVAAKPEAAGAVVVACDSAAAAEQLGVALLQGPVTPCSVDLLNAPAAARVLKDAPGDAPLHLLVGFDGGREAVAWQLGEARRMLGAPARVLDGGELATARQALANLLVTGGVLAEPRTMPPVSIRFSLSGETIAAFVAERSRCEPGALVWSQFTSGVVCSAYDRSILATAAGAIEAARALGGTWQVVAGGGARDLPFVSLGPPRDEWELMRRVKRALDPHDVFERGGWLDRALRVS